ncbi:hypothetical protein ACIGFK_12135 [Streptomyces sp. NPDC085524]|uniref:hypothetical protein n=1 Tax=unclassified Streptomyces TaxID=2593676 RepID=UPI0035D73248
MTLARTRRLAVAAASAALALGGILTTAGSASASPGESTCSVRNGVGTVCIYEGSSGYNAKFYSSMSGKVDFNLLIHNGIQHVGDGGEFYVTSGGTYSYYFASGRQPDAAVCIYSRDGQFGQLCTPVLTN